MQEDKGFWRNVFVAFMILSLAILCAKIAFADEADDVIEIQGELITNLEQQVEKQKQINKDNEKIIENNVKITQKQFDEYGEDFEKTTNGYVDLYRWS